MDTTTALLLGLIAGLALGAILTAVVMRTRRSTEGEVAARTAEQLLALADERYARDEARRAEADASRDGALQQTLGPITFSLGQLERSLARTEQARAEADGALQQHLHLLSAHAEQLSTGTSALTAALRAPTARGRWGEVQLRRIVEAAGMLEHVDFSEQVRSARADGKAEQRPDMVVRLTGERSIVVDAKAPMDAYLDAVEEQDPARAAARRTAHAKALRHHVGVIASKAYWKALGDTPEFTVLFVPSDGVLTAALETDPALLDDAFGKDVVIASPATLVALLRTVAHTWRTEALNRDAREVLETGRELHHRLGTFTTHLGKVGRSLDSSVAAFNDAVGSLQSRVMVTARRFEDLGLPGTRLEDVEQLERRARTLDDAEITDLAGGSRRRTGAQGREAV